MNILNIAKAIQKKVDREYRLVQDRCKIEVYPNDDKINLVIQFLEEHGIPFFEFEPISKEKLSESNRTIQKVTLIQGGAD